MHAYVLPFIVYIVKNNGQLICNGSFQFFNTVLITLEERARADVLSDPHNLIITVTQLQNATGTRLKPTISSLKLTSKLHYIVSGSSANIKRLAVWSFGK